MAPLCTWIIKIVLLVNKTQQIIYGLTIHIYIMIQDKSLKISAYLIEGYSKNASYALHKISTFILFDVRYSVRNATEIFHLYFLLSRKITVLKWKHLQRQSMFRLWTQHTKTLFVLSRFSLYCWSFFYPDVTIC